MAEIIRLGDCTPNRKRSDSFLMKTMDGLRFGMAEVDACCKERGNFQDKFGFGASPR